MSEDTRSEEPQTAPIDKAFLCNQFNGIRKASLFRTIGFISVLFITIATLYLIFWQTINARTRSINTDDIISTGTLRDLEDIYEAKKIKKERPEFFDQTILNSVRGYIKRLRDAKTRKEWNSLLKFAIEKEYNSVCFKIYRIHPVETIDDSEYKKFELGKTTKYFQATYPSTYFKKRITPEEIRSAIGLSVSDELTSKQIYSAKNKLEPLFISRFCDETFYLNLKAANGVLAENLEYAVNSNLKQIEDFENRIKSIVDREKSKIADLLAAPNDFERYNALVQKGVLSFVLVTIALTLLVLIKNEVSLIARTQSITILAGGLNFNVKDVSLFDAMEKLHSYKLLTPKPRDFRSIFESVVTEALRKRQ